MRELARPLLTVAIAAAVACGGATALSTPTPTTASTSTASAVPTPTTAATASTAPSATAAVAKVSANNATIAQLTAAFTAAGIPNPSAWAREVEEYRPYAASDTNMTKLRQNLAKYNPAPGVVDKIVATLSLP
jgi:hypothetical protein